MEEPSSVPRSSVCLMMLIGLMMMHPHNGFAKKRLGDAATHSATCCTSLLATRNRFAGSHAARVIMNNARIIMLRRNCDSGTFVGKVSESRFVAACNGIHYNRIIIGILIVLLAVIPLDST